MQRSLPTRLYDTSPVRLHPPSKGRLIGITSGNFEAKAFEAVDVLYRHGVRRLAEFRACSPSTLACALLSHTDRSERGRIS